jgi:zinc protease
MQARLPKMKKADVDRAMKKHWSLENLAIALVVGSGSGQALADKLVSGEATPITYDTAGTPPEVLDEDKVIERFPVPIAKGNVRVVPVDQLFEKTN